MHYSAAFQLPYLTVQYTVCLRHSSLMSSFYLHLISHTCSQIPNRIIMISCSLPHRPLPFLTFLLIPSYTCADVQIVTVIFALILACVASTVALFMFFKFRSQWMDSWWRRGLCAVFLATAVCGMHFLGLGGTSYFVREGIDPAVLSQAGDQATRLTIGESTRRNWAKRSHLGHVWCHCPVRYRLPCLRCKESKEVIKSRSSYRHCLGCL